MRHQLHDLRLRYWVTASGFTDSIYILVCLYLFYYLFITWFFVWVAVRQQVMSQRVRFSVTESGLE